MAPGSAGIIIDLLQTETQLRRSLEERDFTLGEEVVRKQLAYQGRGQVLAAVIALTGFGVAAFALQMHEPAAAALICGGTLGSMVVAFLTGGRRGGIKAIEAPKP